MSVVYVTPGRVEAGAMDGALDDWGSVTRTPAPRAFVLSADSSLDGGDGSNRTATQGWTLYVPRGERVPGPRDRVEADWVTYAQDGVVACEVNPFTGWRPYTQVKLRRHTGTA